MKKSVGAIYGMLKQAHQLTREMGRVNEGLAAIEAEGSAGKGAVRAVMDGQMRLTRVTIAPELLTRGDADALSELILAAVNQAREQAQKLAAEAVRKMAGVPGGIF